MSRKIFILTLAVTSLFILGLLTGVFAAIQEDSDYGVDPPGSTDPNVKYWSKVALTSVTNAVGGQWGHYSATSWHWGKVENVDYHRDITLQVSGGSIWDHDDALNDNDLHTAKWWAVDPDEPGLDPPDADTGEGEWDQKSGGRVNAGDSPTELSFTLTNSYNYGSTGEHTIRGFTTTVSTNGPGTQVKSVFDLTF